MDLLDQRLHGLLNNVLIFGEIFEPVNVFDENKAVSILIYLFESVIKLRLTYVMLTINSDESYVQNLLSKILQERSKAN